MTHDNGAGENSGLDARMSIMEHLEELRQRITKAVLAVAASTLLCLIFTNKILEWRLAPAGDIKPVFLRPTEMFLTYMRVGLVAGVALAMPVIVYQLLRFLAPGLEPKEKRYLYSFVPGATFFFIAGVAFAYFAMLPFALKYLLTFGSDLVNAMWAIGEYISFVTSMLLWVGVAFETPMVIFFMAKLKVVNVKKLTSFRKFAIVGAFVLAAVITPTPDPFNQLLVAIPIILLYELGIIMARFA
jgi:sec-independent protein translocase protein TatC